MAKSKSSARKPDSSVGVFVSWSGNTSQAVAEALRLLIPNIFQDVKVFVSSNDIDAGSNWFGRISNELSDTNLGVLCLTRDNLSKPWVHFEAGALAKKVGERTLVIPYLFDLSKSDISPPLGMFQAVEADNHGTLSLLSSLNKVREGKFESARLHEIFDKWWPDYEQRLKDVPKPTSAKPHRSDRELLEELLAVARNTSNDFQQIRRQLIAQLAMKIVEIDIARGRESDYRRDSIVDRIKNEYYSDLSHFSY